MPTRPQLFKENCCRLAGRYATVLSVAGGVLVLLLSLLATTALILRLEMSSLNTSQVNAASRITGMAHESKALLDRLNQHFPPNCSESNLTDLRVLLLEQQYIRDIGIFDERNRLICTTGLGTLPVPLPGSLPDLVSPDSTQTRFDVSLYLGNGHYRTTVVRRGRFNLVISPRSINQDIPDSGVDAIWVRTDRYRLIWANPKLHANFINSTPKPYLAAQQNPAGQMLSTDLENRRFVSTRNVPDTSYVIQSYRHFADLPRTHAILAAVLSLISALLGVLIAVVLQPRLHHFGSLAYRARDLCREVHILCHYQPIIELATGRVVGCEVLFRIDDGGKIIFPDTIIPTLLTQHLGWQIDRAVSGRALRELGRALPAQQDFKIALNFFPQNIVSERLHAHLSATLAATGRNDLHLNIEVTEYGIERDMVSEIQRLKSLGYRISVDDFGTGYSNLGSVKKIAPDFLKIDKSFVFDMEDASLRSSLIPEIVAIAQAIDAEVIAEGIENAAQAEKLRAVGVRFGQGYFYARPMPLEAFVQYLQRSTAALPSSA